MHLPFRFSAKPSPCAPWSRGLLSAFWERGSPDLPACGLQRGSSGGPMQPSSISSSSRPSRGAKPCGENDEGLPQERPHHVGSRGGREIKARVPREVLMTQAVTIETRRAPACAVSCFLFGAKEASRGAHVESTAMRRPRPQAVGARGAPHLPLSFSTKPSPSAPWARGLLSAFWERGSADLPAYGLRHGPRGGPVRPIFISARLKTLARGQASRADDTRLPQERPR